MAKNEGSQTLTDNVRAKIKERARTFADDNFLMPNASIYTIIENAMFEGSRMALEEVPALIKEEVRALIKGE